VPFCPKLAWLGKTDSGEPCELEFRRNVENTQARRFFIVLNSSVGDGTDMKNPPGLSGRILIETPLLFE